MHESLYLSLYVATHESGESQLMIGVSTWKNQIVEVNILQ